jgi:hypothetical protein
MTAQKKDLEKTIAEVDRSIPVPISFFSSIAHVTSRSIFYRLAITRKIPTINLEQQTQQSHNTQCHTERGSREDELKQEEKDDEEDRHLERQYHDRRQRTRR